MRTVLLVCLLAVSGCYEPALRDCTVQCSAEGDCAGQQVCRGGWCTMPGAASCGGGDVELPSDAARLNPVDDAPPAMADARDLCAQGCSNGNCVGGVCVIDCSAAGSCANDVKCPVNLPCRVVCGDHACDHKIICTDSSSCTIECIGQNACGDEIHCGTTPCDVTCSGVDSCEKKTKCSDSCGCNVTCSGAGSCSEASECPTATCRVGNGCSSQPLGCDVCL